MNLKKITNFKEKQSKKNYLSEREDFYMKKNMSKQNLLGITMKILTIGAVLVIGNKVVLATNDPLAVINNLKNFMYQIIGAIGMILLLWGIVQIGMAIKSHDPSQRANRFYDSSRWNNNCICKTDIRINFRLNSILLN